MKRKIGLDVIRLKDLTRCKELIRSKTEEDNVAGKKGEIYH